MKKQAKILVASLLFAAGVAPALASANNFEVNDNTNLTNKTEDILVLYDAGQNENGKTNTEILRDFIQNVPSGGPISIQLKGRTLYRDGTWNTICLPFTLDKFEGTIFKGATVMSFDHSVFEGGILELVFDEEEYEVIAAGMPFFVKWKNVGSNVTDPEFNNVTIESEAPENLLNDLNIDFMGVFNNLTFEEEQKDILYLGEGNNLFYPSPKDGEPVTIGAFRGYFKLKNDLTAGNPINQNSIRAFKLVFEGEETAITSIIADESLSPVDESWYTLDGRRLSGKPTTSGLYISNGRKVIIK